MHVLWSLPPGRQVWDGSLGWENVGSLFPWQKLAPLLSSWHPFCREKPCSEPRKGAVSRPGPFEGSGKFGRHEQRRPTAVSSTLCFVSAYMFISPSSFSSHSKRAPIPFSDFKFLHSACKYLILGDEGYFQTCWSFPFTIKCVQCLWCMFKRGGGALTHWLGLSLNFFSLPLGYFKGHKGCHKLLLIGSGSLVCTNRI